MASKSKVYRTWVIISLACVYSCSFASQKLGWVPLWVQFQLFTIVTSSRPNSASYRFQDFVACKVFKGGDCTRLFPASPQTCMHIICSKLVLLLKFDAFNAFDRQTPLITCASCIINVQSVLNLCCDCVEVLPVTVGYCAQGV